MCEKTLALYRRLLQEQKRERSGKRLTVLQLLPELEGGGVERGTLEMGRYLSKMGHRSLVVSGGGRLVPQLEAEGSWHIKYLVGSKSPLVLLHLWPLKRLIQRERVNILHLRSRMPAWAGILACKMIPASQRPLIVTTFHGFYSVNGYSAIMTRGDMIIAVSDGISRHIRQKYGKVNIRLIYRGVDTEVFNPERVSRQDIDRLKVKWELDEQRPVIMLPARITRLKGHDYFLKALVLVRGRNYQAVLVGDRADNPGLVEELEQLITENSLEPYVKFVGYSRDMPVALSLADVVVSASSLEPEAFGRTTVEAMAMAKPVIATAHGGSLETVLPGKTGWLVKPADAEDLARAIEEFLAASPQTLAEYGRNGQKLVLEKFTTTNMCKQTTALYAELVKARKMQKNQPDS
ncbi:MAG: glycosyl transferase [Deltaproteobacteria bacterium]|nr:MAG: glycosyl transferase [Deltaproteobacteria bacterium]